MSGSEEWVYEPDPDTLPEPYFEGLTWEQICGTLDQLQQEADYMRHEQERMWYEENQGWFHDY